MAIVKVKRRKEVQLLLEEEFNVEVDEEALTEQVIQEAEDEEEGLSDTEIDARVEQVMLDEAARYIDTSINNEEYKKYELSSQNILKTTPRSSVVVQVELIED